MPRLLTPLLLLAAAVVYAEPAQVPFGDRVGESILNYHRATPDIATSGIIGEGGLQHLKELGFRTILDLRTEAEGTLEERDAAVATGLAYHNIPISGEPPTIAQLSDFARLVESPDSYPLLIHCGSANRVGLTWALYRMTRGVPLEEALQEARTIGMRPSREPQVTGFADRLNE